MACRKGGRLWLDHVDIKGVIQKAPALGLNGDMKLEDVYVNGGDIKT